MKQYTIMIKPASSMCNLRCRYCFYADVSQCRAVPFYGLMTRETVDAMLTQVEASVSSGDAVQFAFQGGEPAMAGLPFFQYFVAEVRKRLKGGRVSYVFQTNGTLIGEEWCRFFKRERFLVGISLDITPPLHNAARVDAFGKGTFERVNQCRMLMRRMEVEYNVLAVLTNDMARHPQQIWNAILNMGLTYVQFIPCLDDLDAREPSPYALTPQRFARFYNGLFPLWLDAFQRGTYISIKFFDDVINLLARGQVNACGLTGQCCVQLVVESDGSVYPCDFYALDDLRMGNFRENTIPELLASPAAQGFLRKREPPPSVCGQCAFQKLCGGGCRRMRSTICASKDFCGYREFLQKNGASLWALVSQMRANCGINSKRRQELDLKAMGTIRPDVGTPARLAELLYHT